MDVVLDHDDDDDDDMNPDANGAVVINMGGHPEDGMVEGGTSTCHVLLSSSTVYDITQYANRFA